MSQGLMAVLTSLASVLSEQRSADPAEQFWVVRGRANVLARARALIDEAAASVALGRPQASDENEALADALDRARARGCRITVQALDPPVTDGADRELLVLLADDRQALAGTLVPPNHCQAVVGGNPGLLAAVQSAILGRQSERELAAVGPSSAPITRDADYPRPAAWIDWEARKHDRLRRLTG